ncbi:uncharacterized protein BBA_09982 [Beauveria bassiana ARSEF 2860]|uniref:Uncharacterized protein n=1 Tax=Beauveria bassiana (strain ARSEF 2860) TaxID=655819 RepID=J4UF68_BEAB2|nr:uncharacterized protein BBA_09982 [Beauveria bassiana ARSEF 2860]EJP61082.1 hypothetical protein BBA_09982 [Beauveria bassiana ARSEF 2860]
MLLMRGRCLTRHGTGRWPDVALGWPASGIESGVQEEIGATRQALWPFSPGSRSVLDTQEGSIMHPGFGQDETSMKLSKMEGGHKQRKK